MLGKRRSAHRVLRASLGIAAVPALLLLLRLGWGWESAHRLAEMDAELRARGITRPPVNIIDAEDPWQRFARISVPLSAGELEMVMDADGTLAKGDLPWMDEDLSKVRSLLAKCDAAFNDLDAAAKLSGPVRPVDPGSGVRRFAECRSLARLLYYAAMLAHHDGDDAKALRFLCRIQQLSRLADMDETLLGHLVSIACFVMCSDGAEVLAPALTFDADGAVRREAVKLLAVLQDEIGATKMGLRNSWSGETRFQEYYTSKLPVHAWWIRPLEEDDLRRAHQLIIWNYNASDKDSWPETVAALGGVPRPWNESRGELSNLEYATFILSLNAGFTPKINLLHFRGISGCGASAILLAAQLHFNAHGTYPASVDALAPEFLRAIPSDPFATGQALHYRLDAEGPTVWSVSENGTDEGAVVRAEGGKVLRRWGLPPHEQADIIFGAAWRRAVPYPWVKQ